MKSEFTTWRLSSFGYSVCLAAVLLLKYGYGLHPQWFRFADAAQHWPDVAGDSLLAVGDRALLSNSAPAWIAGAFRQESGDVYIALYAILTALAICGPILLKKQIHVSTFNRLYFIVIAGGALAPVLLMWIGGYDALLVCGLSLGVLAQKRAVAIAGWALAAFTHSSVALPGAFLFAVYLAWNSKVTHESKALQRAMDAVLGVLLGFAAIHWLTDLWGGSTDRLALFQKIPFSAILQSYMNSLPVLLVSGLGVTWLLLIFRNVRTLKCSQHFYALSILAIVLLPLIAVDQSRIIALCLAPLTLVWIQNLSEKLSDNDVGVLWRRMAIPAVVVPIGVVWMGTTYWPYWL